jgi:hypothetical protein
MALALAPRFHAKISSYGTSVSSRNQPIEILVDETTKASNFDERTGVGSVPEA